MSVQGWKRRLACQWSVEVLFPDLGSVLLDGLDLYGENPVNTFSPGGFLWTFTFAEERLRLEDHLEVRRRWKALCRWLVARGYKYVWGFERGYQSGHYHYHAVTPQYWSANEMHALARKFGFGRIDVKEVPREKLTYLAKYIGKMKPRWKMPKGARLWGCIGFTGVRTNDIRFHEKTLTLINGSITDADLRTEKRWAVCGEITGKKLPNHLWPGEPLLIKTMNITKENAQHLTTLLANGTILAVGEYRTCKAREMKFRDEKTEKEKVRKLVEHGIELGLSEQITVTEWLPDDADLANVKPVCVKGDPCVVVIDGFSKKYGITAKSISPLSNFNGKLA